MLEPVSYIPIIAITAAAFLFYDVLLYHNYPHPFKVVKIRDSREKRKIFYDYITSISSLVHAIAVIVASVIVLNKVGMHFDHPNINEENLIISFSIGYFISDTILGAYAGYNDILMLMHHAFGLFGLSYALIKQSYGNAIMCAFAIAEISNPFMILRKNFDKHRGAHSLSVFCGIIFSISFIICRTVIFGYFMIPFISSKASLVVKIFAGLIWYLSLYWCYVIVNLLVKAFMDMSNSIKLIELYGFLTKLRKNTTFLICMHGFFVFLCFFNTFYDWNHKEII